MKTSVCGQPIGDTRCVLRKGHGDDHEPLRDLPTTYNVIAAIQPASGAHDRCSLCFRTVDYGEWMMVLPETRDGSLVGPGPIRFHRECGEELRVHLTDSFPNGPAPDASETDDPDDWR